MITKSSFIGQVIDDINKYYEFGKEIGHGAYGKVYLVTSKRTKKQFACKQMNKRKITNKERFKVEIDLLKATDHPNIVKLYELYEDKVYLYLIMELCQGGELFARLSSRSKNHNLYNEKQACFIFKQLMSAINYCHVHGVCHRDIKPENLLFSSTSEDANLKVADFGLSRIFTSENNRMTSIVGTTFYMSPEVLNGDYNEKCDIWSSGCILYIMICGRPPFYSKNDVDLVSKIKQKSYSFNYPEFQNVSSDLIDLLSKMLCDGSKRLTAQEVLDHVWMKHNAPNSKECLLDLNFNEMIAYSKMNKFKQGVFAFISSKLTDEESNQLIKIFHTFDKNRDGVLTLKEIKDGIKFLKDTKAGKEDIKNFDTAEIENFFNRMDLDKNGLINYTEFIASAIDHKSVMKKEMIYDAFKAFDTDKSGNISIDELREIIRPQNKDDDDYVVKLFDKYDLDKDNNINFEEFMNMLDEEEDII